MKHVIVLVAVLSAVTAIEPSARAGNDLRSFLIGPVVGVRLTGPEGDHGLLGVEGGVGWGPERINLGFEHRANRELYYLELDPWFFVGGSLGFGVDSAGQAQGIVGLWEGIPIAGDFLHGCRREFSSAVTLAGGLRYTGVLELYVTVKAGVSEPICF